MADSKNYPTTASSATPAPLSAEQQILVAKIVAASFEPIEIMCDILNDTEAQFRESKLFGAVFKELHAHGTIEVGRRLAEGKEA